MTALSCVSFSRGVVLSSSLSIRRLHNRERNETPHAANNSITANNAVYGHEGIFVDPRLIGMPVLSMVGVVVASKSTKPTMWRRKDKQGPKAPTKQGAGSHTIKESRPLRCTAVLNIPHDCDTQDKMRSAAGKEPPRNGLFAGHTPAAGCVQAAIDS